MGVRLGRRRLVADDDLAVAHEINVTPFIDVMLVLLIIFMVAAPLATVDLGVDLPASAAAPQPRPDKPVYRHAEAGPHAGDRRNVVARDALGGALQSATKGNKDERIFLRADKAVSYGDLMAGDEPAARRRLSQDRAGRPRRTRRAMNAFALHDPTDQAGTSQWMVSAVAIVAAHLGLIVAGGRLVSAGVAAGHRDAGDHGRYGAGVGGARGAAAGRRAGPARCSRRSAAPRAEPEQPRQPVQPHQIEPVPPQAEAGRRAAAGAEAEPTPAKPEAGEAGAATAPKPEPPKPKPVRAEAEAGVARNRRRRAPPPRRKPSATPRWRRCAAGAGAAAAAALPSYRDRLAAHLQRFKQYPSGAKAAGEQGTAMLSFTVGRDGQVLGSRLAGSSGHPALDAETMAMIRRAQPLPSFPPETDAVVAELHRAGAVLAALITHCSSF